MECVTKFRTPEQKVRKSMNEQRLILDLQMAIKKEQFRNFLTPETGFNERYEKVTQVSHDCCLTDN